MLTASRLAELMRYEPITGAFIRVKHVGGQPVGSYAGTVNSGGYIVVSVDGVLYQSHRLAWLAMTGEWPSCEIDHRNLNRQDNAWRNLREATGSQNQQNKSCYRNNTLGVKGVRVVDGRFNARITKDGKTRSLGCFDTVEDAAATYADAALSLHGDFARAA